MNQEYQLEILTPVHIGTGETLTFMDGCYVNGRWYHIDLDKVLAHPNTDLNALTSDMSQRGFRWERYLRQHNTDLSELSAYNLLCPQSPEEVEIREAIKAVGNRPYIPGSTLKGAIRTAMLGEILSENDDIYFESLNHLKTSIDRGSGRNPRKEQPARQIEGQAFGKDPNHDCLRALHITDTRPIERDTLEIGLVWTVTLDQNDTLVQKIDRGQEYKNFVQQIRVGQKLTFTLKIDEFLLRQREKTRLGWTDLQEQTLRDIAEVCRSATDALMQEEQEFFDYYNLPEIANVYDKLIDINKKLPEGEFLLRIGWGTGYTTNTVTSLFTNDEEAPENLWMNLRERFRLGESRRRRGHYDPREFPKTRRILYRGQNPLAPFGWVKISPLKP